MQNKHFMKNVLLILLTCLIYFNGFGQISFEEGYYINNQGKQINCLIKNIDWYNNPSKFECKDSEIDEFKILGIDSVQEFGITNKSKYVRSSVRMDKSSVNINELSKIRGAIWEDEVLFLKILVEGEASLYLYQERDLSRFFYKINNGGVEQLVYKIYKTKDNKIGENNSFKQQLYNYVRSELHTMSDLKKLDYSRNDLIRYFKKYNVDKGSVFVNYDKDRDRNSFHLTIRPGIVYSNSKLDINDMYLGNVSFNNVLSCRFGAELEFNLGFNGGKWAVFAEPTFQYTKASESKELSKIVTADLDYKSIELPIGLRHYFFLNDKSKLFVNGSLIIDFEFDSKIEFNRYPDLEITTRNNLAVGFGYKYLDKYSVELRYGTKRELLSDYMENKLKYESISIILGISIF